MELEQAVLNLGELQASLEAANQHLEQCRNIHANRSDGSPRQDRLADDILDQARNDVFKTNQAVIEQKALVETLLKQAGIYE